MNYGKTRIVLCGDEFDLGRQAARAVARVMRRRLARPGALRVVFAAGESQNAFFAALAKERDLDWSRVACFNMDDFLDRRMPERYTCGYQTRTQLYDKVRPQSFHLVRFNAPDPQAEARRFEALLREAPIDITCQGIGTSGHLALNEPGQTDFQEKAWVKVVTVAEQSKKQLMADPNFRDLGRIPGRGITMTIPALVSARRVFTIVPLALKRDILTRVLSAPGPTETLPATILRVTSGTLFVDRNSCPDFLRTRFNAAGAPRAAARGRTTTGRCRPGRGSAVR